MVKRSSFLGKLFSKKRQEETRKTISTLSERSKVKQNAMGKGNGKGSSDVVRELRKERIQEQEQKQVQKPVVVTPLKKEDAQKAVVEGLKDLSGLLQSIQGRMEEQGERTGKLLQKFEDLPETAKAQIRFLEKISVQMETQYASTAKVLENLSRIHELLSGVKKILES